MSDTIEEHGIYEAYRLERQRSNKLRATLEVHAVKLQGPRSPFWQCQYCQALQTSPLAFPHKPECVMAQSRG